MCYEEIQPKIGTGKKKVVKVMEEKCETLEEKVVNGKCSSMREILFAIRKRVFENNFWRRFRFGANSDTSTTRTYQVWPGKNVSHPSLFYYFYM